MRWVVRMGGTKQLAPRGRTGRGLGNYGVVSWFVGKHLSAFRSRCNKRGKRRKGTDEKAVSGRRIVDTGKHRTCVLCTVHVHALFS